MPATTSRWELPVLGLLLLAAAGHAVYFDHIADDAYISFRYAANLGSGEGLVFNPGERVMGYSNAAWVALLGAAEAVGVGAPLAARVLGIGLGWALLGLVYAHLRAAWPGTGAGLAGAALLASNGTFALWLQGGLEGPLFALALTGAVVVALGLDGGGGPAGAAGARRFVLLGLLLTVAALTRPEGVFYGLVIAGVAWLRCRDAARAKGLALSLAILAVAFAVYTVAIAAYYGDPLPNPYYAKAHPLTIAILSRGLRIAWWFVEAYWATPLAIVLVWALVAHGDPRSGGWLGVAIFGAFFVFYVRVGGDGQAYYRMWFWVLPMLALLLGETVGRLAQRPGRFAWGAVLAVVIAAANLQHSFRGEEIARVRRDEIATRDAEALARALAADSPGATVAANNVGILAYASELEVIDMLGLTDRHIARAPGKEVGFPAHESHDGAYVLDRRPDVILYGQPRVFERPQERESWLVSAYPSDADLREDPRFLRDYAFEHLVLPDGRVAPLFRRRVDAAAVGGDAGAKGAAGG